MMLNASHDYALRMCCHLARMGRASSREISEATGAPRDYLIQIAQSLREAGIVEGHPGKRGGYSLVEDPRLTSVLDVVRALDGPRNPDRLGREAEYAERQVLDALDGITLWEVM